MLTLPFCWPRTSICSEHDVESDGRQWPRECITDVGVATRTGDAFRRGCRRDATTPVTRMPATDISIIVYLKMVSGVSTPTSSSSREGAKGEGDVKNTTNDDERLSKYGDLLPNMIDHIQILSNKVIYRVYRKFHVDGFVPMFWCFWKIRLLQQ